MTYYYDNAGKKIEGVHKYISGDVSYIRGDVSDIRGDVSGIRGDVSDIRGDVSYIRGNVSYICGDVSDIRGNVIFISSVGSRRAITSYFFECDVVLCGCFRGTLDEFIKQVHKKYPDGEYRAEYDAVIALFKIKQECGK